MTRTGTFRAYLAFPVVLLPVLLLFFPATGARLFGGEAAVILGGEAAVAQPTSPWPATDALGRRLPTPEDVGPPRPDRFAGIFYFLWHDNPGGRSPRLGGPYDVARILREDPDALKKPDSDLWGPIGMFHYWGEPLYGYYSSVDPWVLRRHASLLSAAGIDVLIFDTTNALTYRPVYTKLCEVFEDVRREGGRTPGIAFMVNTEAGKTARRLFDELYRPGLFRALWFSWQGKPLLICDPKETDAEMREFFTLRRAHWPFELVNTPYAWHWETTYPQVYGYTDDPSKPEQVNVSVAQNLRREDGVVTNMSDGNARGRSFHDGQMDSSPGAVLHGRNAAEQWKRALELDPPFVMVTGWNEWIAGRWSRPGSSLVFVDQFDQESSRDIEPMRGGHGDNYYYQLVGGVRRFKGAPPIPAASGPVTIPIAGGFEAWKGVEPEYADAPGDTLERKHPGAGGLHYENRSGRNDLVAFQVARDLERLYFRARVRGPLSSSNDPAWMWLLLDIDEDPATGWEGYEFLVSGPVAAGARTLQANDGAWKWRRVGEVPAAIGERELALAIPRAALGLPAGGSAVSLRFKWIDNSQSPGDILDVYVNGDAAPEGRFSYRYVAK